MSSDWEPDSDGISRRRALSLGSAAALAALSARGLPSLEEREPPTSEPEGPVRRLHSEGITGEGVRVGVLDTTGFAGRYPGFGDAVVGRRSFDGVPVVLDSVTHGTKAAVSVTRTAPDAELLLASFEQPSGFSRALSWLRRAGADVVLAPVAAYGASVAQGDSITDAATAAARSGLTLVAPTGNAARGYWQGRLQGSNSPQRLHLSSEGGRVVDGPLLAWAGTQSPEGPALSLALLRADQNQEEVELVALSEQTDDTGVQMLQSVLSPGRYALSVRMPDRADRSEQSSASVGLVSATHHLSPGQLAGSIATPAAALGVLAVGRTGADGVAEYSGRGPTADGRPGVDLVASPRFWPGDSDPGTSGAAAYVAGVAALVAGALPAEATNEPATALRATTNRTDQPNAVAGYGEVDPVAAVRRALGESEF